MKLNQLRWIAMCILAQCSVPLFSMESISLTEPEKLGSPEEFARDITDKMLELYPHIDEIMSLGPDFDIASVFEAQEKLRKDIDQDLDSLFKEAEKKDTENRNRLKIPETAPFRQYLMITAGKILKENIESRTLIAAMTRLNSDVFSWLDAATGILLYVLGGQDQIAAITKVEKKLTLKKFIDQRRKSEMIQPGLPTEILRIKIEAILDQNCFDQAFYDTNSMKKLVGSSEPTDIIEHRIVHLNWLLDVAQWFKEKSNIFGFNTVIENIQKKQNYKKLLELYSGQITEEKTKKILAYTTKRTLPEIRNAFKEIANKTYEIKQEFGKSYLPDPNEAISIFAEIKFRCPTEEYSVLLWRFAQELTRIKAYYQIQEGCRVIPFWERDSKEYADSYAQEWFSKYPDSIDKLFAKNMKNIKKYMRIVYAELYQSGQKMRDDFMKGFFAAELKDQSLSQPNLKHQSSKKKSVKKLINKTKERADQPPKIERTNIITYLHWWFDVLERFEYRMNDYGRDIVKDEMLKYYTNLTLEEQELLGERLSVLLSTCKYAYMPNSMGGFINPFVIVNCENGKYCNEEWLRKHLSLDYVEKYARAEELVPAFVFAEESNEFDGTTTTTLLKLKPQSL